MTSSISPQKDGVSKVLPAAVVAPDANKKDEANKTSPAGSDKK